MKKNTVRILNAAAVFIIIFTFFAPSVSASEIGNVLPTESANEAVAEVYYDDAVTDSICLYNDSYPECLQEETGENTVTDEVREDIITSSEDLVIPGAETETTSYIDENECGIGFPEDMEENESEYESSINEESVNEELTSEECSEIEDTTENILEEDAELSESPSNSCGDNLIWFLSSDGVLTVSGSGSMYDFESAASTPWYADSLTIKKIIIEHGVLNIGDYAFYGCGNVKDITLPSTVNIIGRNSMTGICDTDIYYCGSYQEWNSILNYSANTFLDSSSVTFTCNESGFVRINNTWKWYSDGSFCSEMTGLVKGDKEGKTDWYYIVNGVFTKAKGIARKADGSDKKWYYVQDGMFTRSSGIAKKADNSEEKWYYVQDGVYTKASGIARKADGTSSAWLYVENGVFNEATGIAQKADGSSTAWYYVEGGVYKKVSGIAQKADQSSTKWYYVCNGKYTKATGITRKAGCTTGAWYYVENGAFTKATGITRKVGATSGSWYYVKDGIYTKETGITRKVGATSGSWYYVKDGKYTKETGITRKVGATSGSWYYVKDGKYTKATGLTRKAGATSGSWYFVQNGKFTKSTGLAKRADGTGSWYYVRSGVYTKDTGLTQKITGNDENWYYVLNGVYKKETLYTNKLDVMDAALYMVENGVCKGIYQENPKVDDDYDVDNGGKTDVTPSLGLNIPDPGTSVNNDKIIFDNIYNNMDTPSISTIEKLLLEHFNGNQDYVICAIGWMEGEADYSSDPYLGYLSASCVINTIDYYADTDYDIYDVLLGWGWYYSADRLAGRYSNANLDSTFKCLYLALKYPNTSVYGCMGYNFALSQGSWYLDNYECIYLSDTIQSENEIASVWAKK
ncbi:MAG: leucine-rich repeat protein [Parasporobacterium sp.]|nr:leucine-rich repeat protein [Parasporobacterium sp.]